MTNPFHRQAAAIMGAHGTDDLLEAIAREVREPEMLATTEEILAAKIAEMRKGRKMVEETKAEGLCKEEGCTEPRREGKARCDKHQKEAQNAAYLRSKAKKPMSKGHNKAPVPNAQAMKGFNPAPRPEPKEHITTVIPPSPRLAPEADGSVPSDYLPPISIDVETSELDKVTLTDLLVFLSLAPSVSQSATATALWGYLFAKGLAT